MSEHSQEPLAMISAIANYTVLGQAFCTMDQEFENILAVHEFNVLPHC